MKRSTSLLLLTKSRFTELKVTEFCKVEGHLLTIVSETSKARDQLALSGPDVVLLDVGALRYDDLKTMKAIRSDRSLRDHALLMIVPRNDLNIDLELEPDDFIFEDLERSELRARLQLLMLKKHHSMSGKVITVGDLVIDEERFEASLNGRPLELTYMEYGLLHFLILHRDKVFSREALLSRVWGQEFYGGTRTVDVHVRRLRAKLGSDHENHIRTVRNVGYKFVG